jgi:hypothetical protein
MRDAFFFYGTLMDRDLLSKVVGRRVWPRALKPARLPGYRSLSGWRLRHKKDAMKALGRVAE